MPGINWAKFYFKFRDLYDSEIKKHKFLTQVAERFAERFVDTQTAVVVVAQIINISLLCLCQLSIQKDVLSMHNYVFSINDIILFITVILLGFELGLLRCINNYKIMERVFNGIAESHDEVYKP